MTRPHASRSAHRPRLFQLFLALTALLGGLSTGATTATAGGWAVGSLDEIPEASAGDQTSVGFTILQHGVTPVDLLEDPSNDVGISIVGADGREQYFPAVSDGTVGRYVATIEFPPAGRAQWSIRMGWFGDQPLGTLDVTTGERVSGHGWPPLRIGLVMLATGLAAVAMIDAVGGRRRARVAVS